MNLLNLLSNINNTNTFTILLILIVVINLITPLFWYYFEKQIINDIIINITKKINKNEYDKYDKIKYIEKFKKDIYQFDIKQNKAVNAIIETIKWGFLAVITLFLSFINIAYVLYCRDMFLVFIIMIVLNIINYYIFIKNSRNKYNKEKKINYNLINKNENKLILFLPMFQYQEKKVEDMINIHNEKMKLNSHINSMSSELYFLNMVFNKIPYLFLLFYGHMFETSTEAKASGEALTRQRLTILLFINILDNFNNSINTLNNFINQFETYSDNFNIYKEFINTPNNQSITNNEKQFITNNNKIIIKSINLKYNDNIICCYNNKDNIIINIGDIILINGPTGLCQQRLVEVNQRL